MTIKPLFFLILLLLIHPLQADIYKWVDSNGNVHFSDVSQPGAETVTLPPTQTYSPAQTSESLPSVPKLKHQQKQMTYTKILIVEPKDQDTIRSNPGDLSVLALVEPALNKGDMVQLLYDGAPVDSPQTGLGFSLKNVYRGAHTLQVQVLSEEGTIIGKSPTITIYMHHSRVGGGN